MSEYISEIHKLLKLGGSEDDSHFHGAPEALPIHGHEDDKKSSAIHSAHAHTDILAKSSIPGMQNISRSKISFGSLLVYPAIFLAAFAFFYVVLNFPSVLAQVQGLFIQPQSQQVLGSDSSAYYKWINNYFYAVSDPKLLDPNNDIDHDGLTNYEEFLMQTNPIVADSDNDHYPDGIEVINSYNPWGFGVFSAKQKQLAAKLDMITINNRISYYSSANHGIVAGANTQNYDLDRAGQLSIPKLKLQVPLIWSKDPSTFDTDLTKGVIHYPGTALPGENGVIYVSGHSSDYLWKHDPMQSIFAKLNFLVPGDDVFITVYGKDGKTYDYRYQVTGNQVYKPDDQAQFNDNSGISKLNLSTCWPIGTSTNRIVVSAVQVGL